MFLLVEGGWGGGDPDSSPAFLPSKPPRRFPLLILFASRLPPPSLSFLLSSGANACLDWRSKRQQMCPDPPANIQMGNVALRRETFEGISRDMGGVQEALESDGRPSPFIWLLSILEKEHMPVNAKANAEGDEKKLLAPRRPDDALLQPSAAISNITKKMRSDSFTGFDFGLLSPS